MGTIGARAWLSSEVGLLERLVGERIPYADIATRLNRTSMACRTKMSQIRDQRGTRTTEAFTDEHIRYLEAQHDAYRTMGARVNYAEIGAAIGHSSSSCRTTMCRIRARRQDAADRKTRELIRALADGGEPVRTAAPKKATVPKPAPPKPDYVGHIALTPKSKLIFDQELRDRIRERGLTAGFFGDPMPGKSMLDEKKRLGLIP